jgi:hypothetical protein
MIAPFDHAQGKDCGLNDRECHRYSRITIILAITLAIIVVPFFSINAESIVFPPYMHSYGIRKATPKHLFMFFGPRTFFNNPQGLATARLKTWDDPKKKGDDDEVVVYGVNAGKGEIIYNTSMWSLGLYGQKGSGNNQFLEPRGIAADGRGHVFVADSGNNRVVKLFNPKSSLKWVTAFNAAGTGLALNGPSRVGIDEKANAYVTDPGNRRIVVFDSAGRVIRTIPSAGSGFIFENGPTAIAIADGTAHWSYWNNEKAIFCADKSGSRVWKIGFNGKLMGLAQMPKGYKASYGAIDYYHSFWVTDPEKHCVVKFDHDLALLDIFGSRGEGDNQFMEPRGIAIYKRFGQAFIAEKKGAQYFWMGTGCKSVSLTEKDGGICDLSVMLTDHSYLTLFSISGNDTITYFKRQRTACGRSVFPFTVRSNERIRTAGLTLKLEPTYSSFTYNAWYYPVKLSAKKGSQ